MSNEEEVTLSSETVPAVEGDLPEPSQARRHRVARGMVVNSGFVIALGALNLVRSFAVAGFLTAAEFGVWAILLLGISTIGAIKVVIVADKYVQQEEPDQEQAFQRAFTLELLSSVAMTIGMLLLAPLLVVLYDDPDLLAPGLALSLLLPALALSQIPIATYYRRLQFFRQRLLLAIDPVIGTIITFALAIAGLGYWSLVVGLIAGAWATALVAVVMSPYPFAYRFDRATLKEYVHFSWPLAIGVLSGLVIAQLSLLLGSIELGLAGAGAIGLAALYSAWARRVDQIITSTLYPAVCRITERKDLMLEAFVKSNRLALMWSVPFGVGLALFAQDLVDFVIGEQWDEAVLLLGAFGIFEAINAVGSNWTAFMRATGRTRPLAVVAVVGVVSFVLATPLLFIFEMPGFVAMVGITAAVALAQRLYYLAAVFPGFNFIGQALRGFAPIVPAVLAVLGLRVVLEGDRTPGTAALELGVFLVVTAIATYALERELLREATGYLRRRSTAPQAA